MYTLKIKTKLRGFESELSFSHDKEDTFFRKMNDLLNWANESLRQQQPYRQYQQLNISRANDIPSLVPPLCPYHNKSMKVSEQMPGYWFCPALDPNRRNGYCDYTEKIKV